MNAEETEICEFLKARKANFVSANEISRCLGRGRRYKDDRNWAVPVLRRMEVDGIVESNPYGEYRLKGADSEPTESTEPTGFKEALRMPGASLGDTTIIRIGDV